MLELSNSQLKLNRRVFQWCLRNAQIKFKTNYLSESAAWCKIAAEIAGFGCGFLSSPELEEILNQISQATFSESTFQFFNKPKKFLHVMSCTYGAGGHTALVRRWIERRPSNQVHSVCVLHEIGSNEKLLKAQTFASGGQFLDFTDLSTCPIQKADALRNLAIQTADIIILHHHMWDVVPVLAFGTKDVPPCLVLNHADHLFWVGTSICDRILELRDEGAALSKIYRTNKDNRVIGIPLPLKFDNRKRSIAPEIRNHLSIPANSIVFITVGRASKYISRNGISFIDAAISILGEVRESHIIAIGPSIENDDWRLACEQSQGRLHAIGEQANLEDYFSAADIYLEGFPFGSLTCLLEAGRCGLPCVRAPKIIPSIYRSTGKALENYPTPCDVDMYISFSRDLAIMPKEDREKLGKSLSDEIECQHGSGWISNIPELMYPIHHRIQNLEPESRNLKFKDAQLFRWNNGESLVFAAQRAQECSLPFSRISYLLFVITCVMRNPSGNILRQILKVLLRRKSIYTYIS